MAFYDDINFIREYIQHSAVACDDLSEFIFDVPLDDEDDENEDSDIEQSQTRESFGGDKKKYSRSSFSLYPSKKFGIRAKKELTLRSRDVYRNRKLGMEFDDFGGPGTMTDESGNSEPSHRGRGGAGRVRPRQESVALDQSQSFFQFTMGNTRKDKAGDREAGDQKEAAVAAPQVKVVTWQDPDDPRRPSAPSVSDEKLSLLFKPKELPKKPDEASLNSGESDMPKKPPSAFVKAIDDAANVPNNPFSFYAKFAAPKQSPGHFFKVLILLAKSEDESDEGAATRPVELRVLGKCRVVDVIGLLLCRYVTALSSQPKGSMVELPSEEVEDYQLFGLTDEDDDPWDEEDYMGLHTDALAAKFSWDLYVLRYKPDQRRRGTQAPKSNKNPNTIHVLMLGHSVTKTVEVVDLRSATLRHIFDEGMKFFFSKTPNYGARYIMVPYNDQERSELDLDLPLSDFNTKSFLLRRTNCCPGQIHNPESLGDLKIEQENLTKFTAHLLNSSKLKKNDKKIVLSCPKALMSLQQFDTSSRMANWEPSQVVDFTVDATSRSIKLIVYFMKDDVMLSSGSESKKSLAGLSSLNQDSGCLSSNNIRCIHLKFDSTEDIKSLVDYLVLFNDYIQVSPYKKLYRQQSDQAMAKTLSKPLPF